MTRFHPTALLTLMVWAGAPALAAPGAEDVVLPPAAPYMQDGHSDRVTIVWRSEKPAAARVTAWEEGGAVVFDQSVPAAEQSEVVVSGLMPGRHYTYTVRETVGSVWTGRFIANRAPTSAHVRFAVMGDMGSGDRNQLAVAKAIAAWKPEFVVTTGDNVYPRGEASQYGPRFFTPYRELAANSVIYPSLGNHDYKTAKAAPYLNAFVLPRSPGQERYYAFNNGPVRFWVLDSMQPLTKNSPQIQWLEQEVPASPARWKVVVFHHPPYSSGLHGVEAKNRTVLTPLFSRLGVDLVLNGHDHHYERSLPQQGVTYVTTGGGGALLYGVNPKSFSAYSRQIHHFVGISISGDSLAIQAIAANGERIDHSVIRKKPR